MSKSVKDLMHKSLITCPPETSLGQVATILTEHHVHALIVAEQDEPPLGLISDFDLLAGEWLSVDQESLDTMRRMTARDLMTYPIESIDAETPIETAATKMVEKQIHRMLVTENGSPVGVISISNFLASIAAQEKANRESLRDVMSEVVLVCRDKTLVTSAARAMTQTGWRSVIVVDSKGRPLGIVTGNDLMRYAGETLDDNVTVTDVMSRDLLTIDINASLQQAADMMIQNHRHRVIVVDSNDPQSFPLGAISSFDIVAEMAKPGSIWQS
jgi:CBS domain-containing protein